MIFICQCHVFTDVGINCKGGWTDTPPICYELGGRVINVAVRLNDQKPIGAKARKVHINPNKLITIKEYDQQKQVSVQLVLNSIEDIVDYCDPDSSGSLVKSALICCQIIDMKSNLNLKADYLEIKMSLTLLTGKLSLYDQLKNKLNSGLEIKLWSNLPQGSGLGTSSILASCVVAVFWTILGIKFTKSALISGVLFVEQLMTTGGGWQDQVIIASHFPDIKSRNFS